MKLALNQGLSGAASLSGEIDRVLEAERLGYDSVWTAEAYGSDAVVPAAWIAARTERIHVGTGIMQMPARTPAMTAMTAMTLDALSGGRFRLGLGVSGPQVAEGWHGQPFGKPLVKTREYVEIVRAILRREKPLEFRGEYYQIPYGGRAPPDWASRCARSCTVAPTCPSTWPRSGRRTSRWPPRSPTAGSRSSSPRADVSSSANGWRAASGRPAGPPPKRPASTSCRGPGDGRRRRGGVSGGA